MKKVFSIILSVIMLFSICAGLNFTAYALESSGSCGENVTYTYDDETETLIISGTGDMYDYYDNDSYSCEGDNLPPFFQNNNFIDHIVVEDGVTSIGNFAFEGCDYLSSVILPQSVKKIGYAAFFDCKGLSHLEMENHDLEYLGDFAFDNTEFVDYSYSGINEDWWFFNGLYIGDYLVKASDTKNLYIKEGTKYILKGAFYNEVEDTSGHYSEEPFEINKIVFPNSIERLAPLKFMDTLQSVVLPNQITEIPNNMFSGCDSLTNVVIPESVTSIGEYAFSSLGITNIEIPKSVTSIGDGAFYHTGLTSVTIPTSVNFLGKGVFANTELQSVYVSKGAKSFDRDAFGNNNTLKTKNVYYEGSKEDWDNEIETNDAKQTGKTLYLTLTYGDCNIHFNYKPETPDVPVEHTHTPVIDATVAPTCTNDGKTEGSHCSVCGEILVAQKAVKAKGHKSDKGTVTKKPTYTETGIKTYKCTVCGAVVKTETIAKLQKKENTLVAKGETKTLKYSTLKKKKVTVARKNAITVSKAKGKVTYKKVSGNGKIIVNSAGKFTVKKGLKKGTYRIKVKVTATGNTQYNAVAKTVTVTIKVK